MSDELRNVLLQVGVVALTLITPILLVYVRQLARRLAALLDIQLTDQQWKDVDATLEMAVHRGDEFGRKMLMQGLKVHSDEKLQAAMETARRIGPRGMSDYDDQALQDMLEAKLQAMRAAADRDVAALLAALSMPPAPPLASRPPT